MLFYTPIFLKSSWIPPDGKKLLILISVHRFCESVMAPKVSVNEKKWADRGWFFGGNPSSNAVESYDPLPLRTNEPENDTAIPTTGEAEEPRTLTKMEEFEVIVPETRCAGCKHWLVKIFWVFASLILIGLFVASVLLLGLKTYPSKVNTTLLNQTGRWVTSAMNPNANKCTQFYNYSCQAWIDSFEMPSDEVHYTRSFSMVRDRNQKIFTSIMLSGVAYITPAFNLCNDLPRLDARALQPITGYFNRIQALRSVSEAAQLLGELQLSGLSLGAFLTLDISVNEWDPASYLIVLSQAGLSLPDISYYSNTTALTEWIDAVFEAGVQDSTDWQIENVVALETKLSTIMYNASALRNIDEVYNVMSLEQAQLLIGPLASFLNVFNFSGSEPINLAQMFYFMELVPVLQQLPLPTLKAYLTLKLYEATFGLLGTQQRAVTQLYREMISGNATSKNRTEHCTDTINAAMPMLVSYYFVDHFNVNLTEANVMFEQGRQSMSEDFTKVAWMDAQSARMAQMKLELISDKIGYPDVWPDFATYYDGLRQEDYFEMMIELTRREFNQSLSLRNMPVDRSQWHMAPSEVSDLCLQSGECGIQPSLQ